MLSHFEAVVVGVSAGGFRALHELLSGLSAGFCAPVIIVQHRLASSDSYLVTYLAKHCRLAVKEAEEKEPLMPGTVYIAPPDYHLLVEKNRTFSLSVDELVCYARPSVDVLFETAASAFGRQLVGVVLTGANSDGSAGIKAVKAHGGLTIVQDPDSAESKVMPLSAIATGAVDFILPLAEIPRFLTNLMEGKDDRNQ